MASLTPLQGASPLDLSDDARLAFTNNTNLEVLTRLLDNVDTDFDNMETLLWKVEYLQVGRDDDTVGLDVRIMNGATVLAAADAGGTWVVVDADVTNTSDITAGPTAFVYVNTSASKADWDGASVELRQNWSKSKGGDGVHIEVDFAEFTGTYTVAAATQTVVVGIAAETDSSFPVAPVKPIFQTVGLVSETDTAPTVAPVKPITVTVGLTVETDTALLITPSLAGTQTVIIGLVSESDTTPAVTPVKPIFQTVGVAAESDTVLSVTPVKPITVLVGLSAELNSALSFTAVKPIIQAVGISSETDAALAIEPVKPIVIPVGIATETSTALTITIVRMVVVGIAVEVDTAFTITPALPVFIPIGIATSLDTALPITPFILNPIVVLLGIAIEVNIALAIIALLEEEETTTEQRGYRRSYSSETGERSYTTSPSPSDRYVANISRDYKI